ncbi:hypothetical protein DCAR_0726878 [Daucus carota subsp. sativus]|uniref:Mitochondrial carrier protein n=1 Tax=Daucus carota subsp. sativus TaxID=79200 RepID=A0AAF1B7G1_DAUCS|nr:hypothetical protein DCAR_0726878 [Daucus carota subsp. sativus]
MGTDNQPTILLHCLFSPALYNFFFSYRPRQPLNWLFGDTDINWDRYTHGMNCMLDKTRFHIIGAVLFSAQQALLHPTHVVKTRMQVASPNSIHKIGMAVFKHILKTDGIHGIFRGYGTSAVGYVTLTRVRMIALTSLEGSKDMMLKYTEALNMSEATRIGLSNGFGGMLSNLISCVYFVPVDVVSQRLIVQGLGGTKSCNGPVDVVRKVMKAEGFRGMYRGFGLTALTQSPASALWWGSYGAAQHIIWRSLGYRDDLENKPSHMEMVTVQATAGMVAGACSSTISDEDYKHTSPGRWVVGFYRGIGPRFLNMSLYGTTMIVRYELIKRLSVKQR